MRMAVANNDEDSVRRFWKNGVSVNVPDKTGFSAFKYACGQVLLKIVSMMLDSADLVDVGGKATPLVVATIGSHESVVECLINNGANVEEVDKTGKTSLLIA